MGFLKALIYKDKKLNEVSFLNVTDLLSYLKKANNVDDDHLTYFFTSKNVICFYPVTKETDDTMDIPRCNAVTMQPIGFMTLNRNDVIAFFGCKTVNRNAFDNSNFELSESDKAIIEYNLKEHPRYTLEELERWFK